MLRHARQSRRQRGRPMRPLQVPDLEGLEPQVRRRHQVELRKVPVESQGRSGRPILNRGQPD